MRPSEIFLATFTSVFVAELGDKTQLATMALSGATPNARWMVFGGSALALVLSSAIGVLVGAALGRFVSVTTLHRVGGVLFLGMGAWMLFRAGR
ncbi:MAG: TMEM165/GDT1 family protein [Myxococcales bacterium]|nr:TMEM165/GDT1 family protein [Myxococcales bacterium]